MVWSTPSVKNKFVVDPDMDKSLVKVFGPANVWPDPDVLTTPLVEDPASGRLNMIAPAENAILKSDPLVPGAKVFHSNASGDEFEPSNWLDSE